MKPAPTENGIRERITELMTVFSNQKYTCEELRLALTGDGKPLTISVIYRALERMLKEKEIERIQIKSTFYYSLMRVSGEIGTSRQQSMKPLGMGYLESMRGAWDRARELYPEHRHFMPVQDGIPS